MAKFCKAVNVWDLSEGERASLQPGQWVTAGPGPDAPKGRYMGQRPSGADVVAWQGNAKGNALGPVGYIRALRTYAKAA